MTSIITMDEIIRDTKDHVEHIIYAPKLTDDEKFSHISEQIKKGIHSVYNLNSGRSIEIENEFNKFRNKLHECQELNKKLQSEKTKNDLFKESYLSAYNQIANMDIDPDLKKEILSKF